MKYFKLLALAFTFTIFTNNSIAEYSHKISLLPTLPKLNELSTNDPTQEFLNKELVKFENRVIAPTMKMLFAKQDAYWEGAAIFVDFPRDKIYEIPSFSLLDYYGMPERFNSLLTTLTPSNPESPTLVWDIQYDWFKKTVQFREVPYRNKDELKKSFDNELETIGFLAFHNTKLRNGQFRIPDNFRALYVSSQNKENMFVDLHPKSNYLFFQDHKANDHLHVRGQESNIAHLGEYQSWMPFYVHYVQDKKWQDFILMVNVDPESKYFSQYAALHFLEEHTYSKILNNKLSHQFKNLKQLIDYVKK